MKGLPDSDRVPVARFDLDQSLVLLPLAGRLLQTAVRERWDCVRLGFAITAVGLLLSLVDLGQPRPAGLRDRYAHWRLSACNSTVAR